MFVLIFSTISVWDISHSKNSWERNDKKCILVFTLSTHYSCQILMKLEFSQQIFVKHSNIYCHENPSSGSWAVPCRRMDERADRQTDMLKLIIAFCNVVKKKEVGQEVTVTYLSYFLNLYIRGPFTWQSPVCNSHY